MAAIRIVLADDHPIVRDGVRLLLERDPELVVVGEAGDGEEALRLVAQLAPDVLILDMALPDMDGVEVARRLRAAGSPVRVLGLSAHDDEEYITGLLASGAAGYLTKDEARQRIVEAVRGVARGETGWLSRQAAARLLQRQETTQQIILTDRERQLLRHLAMGDSNARIAATLHLSEQTVSNYLSALYTKLAVPNRHAAAVWARKRNLT